MLEQLRARREEIVALCARYGAYEVRVFGSVARGDTHAESDVDLLVTFRAGASIFDQIGLWQDLNDLLGCSVDLLTDHPQAGAVTQHVRQHAVML